MEMVGPCRGNYMSETSPSTTQVVITLSVPGNEIIKVEALDKSGRRHALGTDEFASLAGDSEVESLLPVLEQAYEAGFSDANTDVFQPDDDSNDDEDDL